MDQMPELIFLLAYAILGCFAGMLAGLLGVGGGLVIVPVLIGLFTLQGFEASIISHAAIGSSLASIIATAVSSTRAHHARAAVDWDLVMQLAPGLLLGAFLGAWGARHMDSEWLKVIFGVFAMLVSVQMYLGRQAVAEKPLPAVSTMAATGGLIGVISGIVGIGGGSMTVPFLTWHHVSIRRAIATSSACGLPIAIAGFLGFVIFGLSQQAMPPLSSGFVYWPAVITISLLSVLFAPIGARMAHTLPVAILKKIFALMLFLVGLKLSGVI